MTKYRPFILTSMLLALIQLTHAAESNPRPWSGVLGLSNENNYLGIKTTTGEIAVHAGVNYTASNGIYAGIQLIEIDYVGYYFTQKPHEYEVDYLFGLYKQYDNDWAYHISIGRYTYNTDMSHSDYDYSELLISADYRGQFNLTLGLLKNFYRYEENSQLFEINTQHPISDHWVLNAGLGHINLGNSNNQGYLFGSLGIGRQLNGVDFNISYIETGGDAEDIFGALRSDGRFTVSIVHYF